MQFKARNAQTMIASGLNMVAGLWLVISPAVFGSTSSASTWNHALVGILLTCLAAARYFNASMPAWLSWINVVLGAWIFLSPWLFGYVDTPRLLWSNMLIGLLIMALGTWSALVTKVRPAPLDQLVGGNL